MAPARWQSQGLESFLCCGVLHTPLNNRHRVNSFRCPNRALNGRARRYVHPSWPVRCHSFYFWREIAIPWRSITRPACIRLTKASARPFEVGGVLSYFSQKPYDPRRFTFLVFSCLPCCLLRCACLGIRRALTRNEESKAMCNREEEDADLEARIAQIEQMTLEQIAVCFRAGYWPTSPREELRQEKPAP